MTLVGTAHYLFRAKPELLDKLREWNVDIVGLELDLVGPTIWSNEEAGRDRAVLAMKTLFVANARVCARDNDVRAELSSLPLTEASFDRFWTMEQVEIDRTGWDAFGSLAARGALDSLDEDTRHAIERAVIRGKPAPPPDYQWRGLSELGRERWLRDAGAWHLDRRRNPSCPPTPDAPPRTVFRLDGARCDSVTGFLCALGEAINGPRGYFGLDMPTLEGCLHGGFGVTVPFSLHLANHERAAEQLGGKLDEIVELLKARGVEVVRV